MWSAFTSAALALVLIAGCGDRSLDLSLTIDASGCALNVPAGGSVLYQVEADGGSFCGGCLAVTTAISDANGLLSMLRSSAPACGGVHPGSTIGVQVTGFAAGGCPAANAPSFCAQGPSQLVPSGTSDAMLTLPLTCAAQCSTSCMPTTCAAQGKDCGAISDGCNMVLQCGDCHPPERCGTVTPNVCSK